MPRDVFVSYSRDDERIAQEVCELLELRGLKCWICFRDVAPGAQWDEAILDAIEECHAFLLILSAHANASGFVKNEVNRAFAKGKTIFTFRVEDVMPGRSLELYLARHHWTDGFPPPVKDKVDRIASAIIDLLDESAAPQNFPTVEAKTQEEVTTPASHTSLGANPEVPSRPGSASAYATGNSGIAAPPPIQATLPKAMPSTEAHAPTIILEYVNQNQWGPRFDDPKARDQEPMDLESHWTQLRSQWGSQGESTLVRGILSVLELPDLTWQSRWKCLVLLRFAINGDTQSRSMAPVVVGALAPFLASGCASVQEAALRLIEKAPVPGRLLWEVLLRAWPGETTAAASWLVRPLTEYCPFRERELTCRIVAETLALRQCEFGTAVWVFDLLNCRAVAPVLRDWLAENIPPPDYGTDPIVYAATVLMKWKDEESVPYIKDAASMASNRYAYRTCLLVHVVLLQALEPTTLRWATELLLDLGPKYQLWFLNYKGEVSSDAVRAVAGVLSEQSDDASVRDASAQLLL
jgi:TIR domain-containing protein